jgi:S1-C subfamily serine protease
MSNRSVFKRSPLSRETLLFLLVLLTAGSLRADDDLCNKIAEVRRIFEERRNAVVRIEAFDRHGKIVGTGFFVDPLGTVYTLAGIVANADEIFVVQGDKRLPAELLITDARSGVALIKVDSKSPFIPIGHAKGLSLADPVMSIGYPMEMDATPTFGILGGFDRKFLGKYFVTTHLRANMPVQAGFSGAPLLDLEGRAVGIIVAGIGNGSACYALPIEAAEKIRTDYARFGEAHHGWIGVTVESSPAEVEGSQVRITELGAETPAMRAGLKNGDILLQVGDVKIRDVEDVIDAAYYLTADDMVTIRVARDGKPVDIDVLAEMHPTLKPRGPGVNVFESPLTSNLMLGGPHQ